MPRPRVLALCVLAAAALVALVLARPERVPKDLSPPPRQPVPLAAVHDPAAPAGEPAAEPEADEPARSGYALTRMDLENGMLKVRSRALACREEGGPPVVVARLSIAPSGGVSHVAVPPEVKGTPLGDCIQRALRAASFPAWSSPPAVPAVEWVYPLRFDDAE